MKVEMSSIGFIKSTRLDAIHHLAGYDDTLFLELKNDSVSEVMLKDLLEGQLAEVTIYNEQIPNRMGTSICRIRKIEGRRIYLEGESYINGTPVLDIFPLYRAVAPRRNYPYTGWLHELMKSYWYWAA
ncbi:MAG: tRNA ((37)-N6)-methyltransferase TrmO [Pseudobdellovibrio sp.]|jgi:hypothetical protein|nr:tRNA ((37)-N6)-methyltransferase TrmO [Pseudobdellovibrio sp.]